MKIKRGRKKSFKWLIIAITSLVLLVVAFWIYDDESMMFYNFFLAPSQVWNQSQDNQQFISHDNPNISDIISTATGQDELISSSNDYSSSGQEVATTGAGLNLLLINSIQTNGYVKELLTILAKHENGDYGCPEGGVPITVEMYLGMMSNETGLIENTFPKTFIPYDRTTKEFIWNTAYYSVNGNLLAEANQMTLENYDKTVFKQINRAAGDDENELVNTRYSDPNKLNEGDDPIYTGPIQLNENEVDYYNHEYSGIGNAGRSKRDFAYFIDDMWQADVYFQNRVIKKFGKDAILDANPKYSAATYSTAHNRGNIYTMAFGWTYKSAIGEPLANMYNYSGHEFEVLKKANVLVDAVADVLESRATAEFIDLITRTECHRWIATLSALESNFKGTDAGTWYISQEMYNLISGSNTNAKYAKEVYIKLFASNHPGVDPEYWYVVYQPYCKTLKEGVEAVLGEELERSDYIRVYGSWEGNYDTYSCSKNQDGTYDKTPAIFGTYSQSQQTFGQLYYVRNERCPYYNRKYKDGSNPVWVHCWDMVVAGHNVAVAFSGQYVYSKLLQYAGVSGVNPVDSTTYTIAKREYCTPEGLNGEIINKMAAVKDGAVLLTSDGMLEKWRIELLNEAYTWVGTPYGERGNGYQGDNGVKWVGVDCTGFVYKVYRWAVNSSIRYVTTSGFGIDSNWSNASRCACWDWIPYTELQAGDIIVSRRQNDGGHAAIVLGRIRDTDPATDRELALDSTSYVVIDSTDRGGVEIRTIAAREFYSGITEPSAGQKDMWYCFRIKQSFLY